ncbi:hypothetical protein [Pseudolysinimonas kribbensis]|uniref:hypothetical protein n=1 Tax=Pseudolysinimonas kribbensis TaxID=433641 RepID=UPI0024E110A4|nr:hypothetical protein [Pseudolysinimonas kribbensis]
MVHVVTDDHSLAARPPIAWALEHHLADRDEAIALVSEPGAPAESYRVTAGDLLTVSAADDRGFVYGIQEIAERLRDGGIADEVTITGRPAVPIRGLVRSFSSVHEDTPWFVDREFWTEYLDFLADCRFSRFHLALGMQYNYGADRNGATDNYLCFAYPFLFDVDGWEVRAEGVHAAEQARNLAALQYIAAETKRRGMDFQLGLWNHAYDYGRDSRHWYPITGLTPETHAAYSAAGLSRLLREVPEVDGLSFRVHYEGGIHENAHEVFWDAMFQAASEAGRPLQIDMHAKGVDQALLDAADKPNISPILSGKYWAEHLGLPYHQARIRHREAARPIPPGHEMKGITEFSRRFTRYGYGDFLREDRVVDLMFRIWPGTQKLLLWGIPRSRPATAGTRRSAGARASTTASLCSSRGARAAGSWAGASPICARTSAWAVASGASTATVTRSWGGTCTTRPCGPRPGGPRCARSTVTPPSSSRPRSRPPAASCRSSSWSTGSTARTTATHRTCTSTCRSRRGWGPSTTPATRTRRPTGARSARSTRRCSSSSTGSSRMRSRAARRRPTRRWRSPTGSTLCAIRRRLRWPGSALSGPRRMSSGRPSTSRS